ncbi:MAG: hypothetical protein APF76_02500 [Desulfitibacter sp. BRH_c19]|nr:MAG: hypothetical protein APF76_02500 [Desulfitibacter sp. BRH_c19]
MNDLKTAVFIAYKSITRGSKLTSALLIFILSISFLNLMFISGLLGGLAETTEQLVVDTETSHIVITPQEEPIQKEFIDNQDELRSEIERIPGVLATSSRYISGGSISYDKNKSGNSKSVSVRMFGIDPQEDKKVLTIADHLVAGEYPDVLQENEIVLGADVAGGFGEPTGNDLGGVKVGDEVKISYYNGVKRTYIVKGIYQVGFFSGIGFVSSKEMESVLYLDNEASDILVKVDLKQDTIDNYLTQVKNINPNLKVRKYTELLGASAAIIAVFNGISLVISFVSVIVAAITIFVLIYVNALNKRRQIGVLKAIGIKHRIIVQSYVFQSLFYAICGSIIGTVLVFLLLVPLLKAYPVELPMGNVGISLSVLRIILSIASIFLASILAGAVPSSRVARQDILQSIRGG